MFSYLLVLSWIAGLSVPAMVTVLFFDRIEWSKQLGGPTWDFTRSWASNITAAGTILSYSVLLSWVAPDAALHFLPRQGYLTIGTIAGGLSVLAPFAFHVTSRILLACRRSSAAASAFLMSAGITIWALTLQLFLGACLLWELYLARTFALAIAIALVSLVLSLSVLVVWYAILTAADTLRRAPSPSLSLEGHLQSQAKGEQSATWPLL
ncbi:MAG: hypothetical protein WBX38_00045 [Candidatus Sulfotelmatobacter sp.]